MPEIISLDKESEEIIKKITKSSETIGTGFTFIINKKGIGEVDTKMLSSKGVIIEEEDYTITLEIEETSDKTTELKLITFKDFITIDPCEYTEKNILGSKIIRVENPYTNNKTGKITNITFDIILLKNLSGKEEFKLSIKGHKIKMIIEKTIYKKLSEIILNQLKKQQKP